MSEVIKNPTPKDRFQSSDVRISDHRKMVASEQFERACDFAMLEYGMRLRAGLDEDSPQSIMNAGLKAAGAQEFLLILRNLSEKPIAPATLSIAKNLDHKA